MRPLHRSGWTLVEVLAVIAVISLLLGLLLPSLRAAARTGRSARSMSQLRQMALAAQQYANTYDVWPPAVRYENTGAFTTHAWDWVQTYDGEILGPGPLWSFTDSPGEVMQCPEYEGDSAFGADPYTGYNYNASYLGGEAMFPRTGWAAVRKGVAPHACSRASTCAIFGVGGRHAGTNKFMRAPLNHEGFSLTTLYNGGQGFRYVGGTTLAAYIDGHVASFGSPKKGELAQDDLLNMHMGYPDNGFLSDDDSAYDPR